MVIGYGVHSIIRQAMQALVPGAKPVPPGTEYASVRELSDQLARPGGITSADLIHFFLARIGTLNPQLNAVIELNPEALQVALERDRERAAGAVRGPLHGIPVLLKDTLETKNMQTSAGAFGLVGDSAGN
ncbi:amidase, partial [Helicobacter pullorum NCTC 12824]